MTFFKLQLESVMSESKLKNDGERDRERETASFFPLTLHALARANIKHFTPQLINTQCPAAEHSPV